MALFSAGISLYAMARVFAALHVFDQVASTVNLPPAGVSAPRDCFAGCCWCWRTFCWADSAQPCTTRCCSFAWLWRDCCRWSLLGLKKDRRMERVEGCGSGRFFARVERQEHTRARIRMGIGAVGLGARRGTCAGRRNVVHGLQAVANGDGGEECGVGAKSSAYCCGAMGVCAGC